MANPKRQRVKGRRESGLFALIPHAVLNSPAYAKLKPRAAKLLLDLMAQCYGVNNGDLATAFKLMKPRGWTSRDQLEKARVELEAAGFIVQTRQGGRNKPSLFAVTWLPIGECGGKLDRAPTQTPLGYWKRGHNPEKSNLVARHTGQQSEDCPALRVNE